MLTLKQVKNNLRIDHDLDDEYISGLIDTATLVILGAIEVPEVPADTRFDIATMFLVAHWYDNREGTGNGNITEIPFGVTALIHQLRGLPHADVIEEG